MRDYLNEFMVQQGCKELNTLTLYASVSMFVSLISNILPFTIRLALKNQLMVFLASPVTNGFTKLAQLKQMHEMLALCILML